jgi:hypothetical protein
MHEDQARYVGTQTEEQSEIAEYIFGIVAKRDGEPREETRSTAWLRGWDEGSVKDKAIFGSDYAESSLGNSFERNDKISVR